MKCNTGGIERTIRVIAGLALVGLAATGVLGVWGYAGGIFVLTGLAGFCPIWAMTGVNTCSSKK